MGQDVQYNNVNFPGRAAASAVRLGSHAARGDYGGCDSARVAQPGSHAARGVRGGRSSASTMRVVIMARLARSAQREVQLALRNSYYISAAPQILFIYMAAAPSTADGLMVRFSRRRRQYTLLMRSCYSEVR